MENDGSHFKLPSLQEKALGHLRGGIKYPFDGRPPVDAAHAAALGVLSNLRDRGGIDNAFDTIDEETRREIVEELSEVIRQAGLSSPVKIG